MGRSTLVFHSRNRELAGLLVVFFILILGFSGFILSRDRFLDIYSLRLPIVLGAFFIVAHLALRLQAKQADSVLLPLVYLLTGVGMIIIERLRPDSAAAQLIWIAAGLASMIVVLILLSDYRWLADFKYIFGILGLIFLLAPIFFGREIGGSKLWLIFAGYSFQPSEFAKIFLVIFLAAYLSEKRQLLAEATRPFLRFSVPEIRHFGPLLLMWIISLAVLVFEKDLGSSLLFFSLFLAMLYVATGRGAYTFAGLALFLMGAALSYSIFGHVRQRVDVWLHPLPADVSGNYYQVAQSLYALAAGGISGTGLGAGFLGTRIHMPAVLTDFIFAAIGEEMGLAGTAAIIIVYLYFCFRGFKIGLSASDDFGRLLAIGLTFSLGLQAAVIIGGVIKAIPLTGVTLPFVSYGGSSIISNFILVGILMTIANREDTSGA